jgi:hypothetical protein
MNFVLRGKIGGSKEPPVILHKFNVEDRFKWISLDLKVEDKGQFGFIIWDSKKNIRSQYLCGEAPLNIVINEIKEGSSAGTLPGPIIEGEWTIEIFAYSSKIKADGVVEGINYEIKIELGRNELKNNKNILPLGEIQWASFKGNNGELYLDKYDWNKTKKQERRWYKGDFHTHTRISDGKMTQKMNMRQAEEMNLDFFVATDHNILSTGWPEGKVLVIPGMEVTSPWGHFNTLGLNRWIDLRPSAVDGGITTEKGMNRLMLDAKKSRALCSINHSKMEPWHWQYKETILDNIDTLEIICDPSYKTSSKAAEDALQLWNTLWNDGYHIWGIGGSDSHFLPHESYEEGGEPSLIGDPATFVLAEELCASKILEGVSKGRVYVSRGPMLDAKIKLDNKKYDLGRDLTEIFINEEIQKELQYIINISNINEEIELRLIENGQVIFSHNVKEDCKVSFSHIWKGREYKWLRLEMRNKENKLIGFTNPVFKGKKKSKLKTWIELLHEVEDNKIE